MSFSKVNLDDLEDQAPKFGIESQEARSARRELGAERIGVSHYRVRPGKRLEFGHRHRSMEEAYMILAGGGTFRIDDEEVAVRAHDIIRIAPEAWRGWEAGPDGMEVLAFGEHVDGDGESELDMGWWPRG